MKSHAIHCVKWNNILRDTVLINYKLVLPCPGISEYVVAVSENKKNTGTRQSCV